MDIVKIKKDTEVFIVERVYVRTYSMKFLLA